MAAQHRRQVSVSARQPIVVLLVALLFASVLFFAPPTEAGAQEAPRSPRQCVETETMICFSDGTSVVVNIELCSDDTGTFIPGCPGASFMDWVQTLDQFFEAGGNLPMFAEANFAIGCMKGVGQYAEDIKGIYDGAQSLKEATGEFLEDPEYNAAVGVLAGAKYLEDVIAEYQADPEAFFAKMASGAADLGLEILELNPPPNTPAGWTRWFGKMLCQVAIDVMVTKGAGILFSSFKKLIKAIGIDVPDTPSNTPETPDGEGPGGGNGPDGEGGDGNGPDGEGPGDGNGADGEGPGDGSPDPLNDIAPDCKALGDFLSAWDFKNQRRIWKEMPADVKARLLAAVPAFPANWKDLDLPDQLQFWDDLSADELKILLMEGDSAKGLHDLLTKAPVDGVGFHELIPRGLAPLAKELGMSAAEIRDLSLPTNTVNGIVPDRGWSGRPSLDQYGKPNAGQSWDHKAPGIDPKNHGGFQSDLEAAMLQARSKADLYRIVNEVHDHWGVDPLPPRPPWADGDMPLNPAQMFGDPPLDRVGGWGPAHYNACAEGLGLCLAVSGAIANAMLSLAEQSTDPSVCEGDNPIEPMDPNVGNDGPGEGNPYEGVIEILEIVQEVLSQLPEGPWVDILTTIVDLGITYLDGGGPGEWVEVVNTSRAVGSGTTCYRWEPTINDTAPDEPPPGTACCAGVTIYPGDPHHWQLGVDIVINAGVSYAVSAISNAALPGAGFLVTQLVPRLNVAGFLQGPKWECDAELNCWFGVHGPAARQTPDGRPRCQDLDKYRCDDPASDVTGTERQYQACSAQECPGTYEFVPGPNDVTPGYCKPTEGCPANTAWTRSGGEWVCGRVCGPEDDLGPWNEELQDGCVNFTPVVYPTGEDPWSGDPSGPETPDGGDADGNGGIRGSGAPCPDVGYTGPHRGWEACSPDECPDRYVFTPSEFAGVSAVCAPDFPCPDAGDVWILANSDWHCVPPCPAGAQRAGLECVWEFRAPETDTGLAELESEKVNAPETGSGIMLPDGTLDWDSMLGGSGDTTAPQAEDLAELADGDSSVTESRQGVSPPSAARQAGSVDDHFVPPEFQMWPQDVAQVVGLATWLEVKSGWEAQTWTERETIYVEVPVVFEAPDCFDDDPSCCETDGDDELICCAEWDSASDEWSDCCPLDEEWDGDAGLDGDRDGRPDGACVPSDDTEWEPRTVTTTYQATPVQSIFSFDADGPGTADVVCDNGGQAYVEGLLDPPLCGKDWKHSSAVLGMVDMTVQVAYDVSWSRSNGESGTTTLLSPPSPAVAIQINEVLTYGVGG